MKYYCDKCDKHHESHSAGDDCYFAKQAELIINEMEEKENVA